MSVESSLVERMPAVVRKTAFLIEHDRSRSPTKGAGSVSRITGMAVLANPCVGAEPRELSALSEVAAEIGALLVERMIELLPGPVVVYGKGAIVGTAGVAEHAAALLHPTLGRPIRAAIGGGAALIPSNGKVASLGAVIDVPVGHRDEAWSFAHIDTVTVGLADAPRADEILLAIVMGSSTRVDAKIVSPARAQPK